ncbi:MAG: protein YgfX [Ectothiorhodospira sp.]
MAGRHGPEGLRVDVGISRIGMGIMGAMHLAAAGALVRTDLPGGFRVAGVSLVALGLIHGLWRYAGPRRITGVVHEASGRLWLEEAGGRRHAVTVLPETTVLPWGVLLSLRDARGRHRRWPLLADAVDADALRRLRGRLRAGPVGDGSRN